MDGPSQEEARARATNARATGPRRGPGDRPGARGGSGGVAAPPRWRPVGPPARPAVAGRGSPPAPASTSGSASRCATTTAMVGVTPASANAFSSCMRVAVPSGAATSGKRPSVVIDIVLEVLLPSSGGRPGPGLQPHGHEVRLTRRGDGERDLARGRGDRLVEARGVGWVHQHDRHVWCARRNSPISGASGSMASVGRAPRSRRPASSPATASTAARPVSTSRMACRAGPTSAYRPRRSRPASVPVR